MKNSQVLLELWALAFLVNVIVIILTTYIINLINMSRSEHKSWYLVEGLRRRKGKVINFSKYIQARSSTQAKRRVSGWNKTVYKMDKNFQP